METSPGERIAAFAVVGTLGIAATAVVAVIAAAVGAAVVGIFMSNSAMFIVGGSSIGEFVASALLAGAATLFANASVSLGLATSLHPVLVGALLATLITGVVGVPLTAGCAGFFAIAMD